MTSLNEPKLEKRIEELETALQNLIDKLQMVDSSSSYQAVFTIAFIHGLEYKGPNYTLELLSAKALLKK